VPRSWYVLARLGQGFAAGLWVGVIWALWIVRRRRPGSVPTTG
jgi:xanthosine utilization system XapX-like protein